MMLTTSYRLACTANCLDDPLPYIIQRIAKVCLEEARQRNASSKPLSTDQKNKRGAYKYLYIIAAKYRSDVTIYVSRYYI